MPPSTVISPPRNRRLLPSAILKPSTDCGNIGLTAADWLTIGAGLPDWLNKKAVGLMVSRFLGRAGERLLNSPSSPNWSVVSGCDS